MTVEDFRTERVCPRCHYAISPGFFHEEMKQPEGSNVVVCSLRRTKAVLRGPLVEVLGKYLNEGDVTRAGLTPISPEETS